MGRKCLASFFAFLLIGCSTRPARATANVAFYLPAQPMSGQEMLAATLSSLDLQADPIIAADEIISYSPASHDLLVTSSAMERLAKLKVPVNGLGFVICVDRKPRVPGAFWPLYSSLSFDGLVVQLPVPENSARLHLYSGYPDVDSSLPQDPRNDPLLPKAFQDAGKLR